MKRGEVAALLVLNALIASYDRYEIMGHPSGDSAELHKLIEDAGDAVKLILEEN